jgi:hypothetical protein
MQTQTESIPHVTLTFEGQNDDLEYFYTASMVGEDTVYSVVARDEDVTDVHHAERPIPLAIAMAVCWDIVKLQA